MPDSPPDTPSSDDKVSSGHGSNHKVDSAGPQASELSPTRTLDPVHALDFLGDVANYGISVFVIGFALHYRHL
jgi:hypothetical protein